MDNNQTTTTHHRIMTLGTIVSIFIFTSKRCSSIPQWNAYGSIYTDFPTSSCTVSLYIGTTFGAIAMPMNALLFLIRVNAVYHHSRLAMMIFILTWLPTCTTIMSPWSIVGSNIGPTSYCIISSTTKHAGFIFLIFTLFDTVIFIAVTLHILSMSSLPSRGSWFKTCINGKGLGKLSKALLYTGQLYYLSVLKLVGFVYPG